MTAQIEALFPNLDSTNYRVTSPDTDAYNCIAWAAGSDDRWWEPVVGYYWPLPGQHPTTTRTALRMFEHLGFAVCESDIPEPDFERVAVYGIDDEYTHAARQLPNGRWTSKLGGLNDIEHDTLEGLVGMEYGVVVVILRRPLKGGA